MSRSGLEAQLEEATQEFVRRILTILRNASLGEVAGIQVGGGQGPTFGAPRGPGRPGTPPRPKAEPAPATRPRRSRSSSEELATQIVDVLSRNVGPMPARALCDQLGVSLDALAKPIKLLRDSGKIVKQGDKRATKYALAESA